MSVRPSLTPEQENAVAVDDGAYLLTAPPGSGKTEVLVRRISRLLTDSAGQSFGVLALTFTNRAAEGIRARVSAEVAEEEWRLFTGTFHHFCLEVLRNHGQPVGVAPDVGVYASLDERLVVLSESLRDEGFDSAAFGSEGLKAALRSIDELRGKLIAPHQAPEEEIHGLPLSQMYAAYERSLDQFGGLDFLGMLTRAVLLLTEHAWTANHYQRLYRYILVDEAQDSTVAQYELLRALCGQRHRNLFVVADRDQSIYRFAGAQPDVILDRFRSDFGARELPLTSNFRSARRIVAVANRLAGHFARAERIAEMSAHGNADGCVEARRHPDVEGEAEATAAWIAQLLDAGLDPSWLEPGEDSRVVPEQIAVLARSRAALTPVGDALFRRGVQPVLRTGDGRLFESRTGSRVHDVLRLLANPRDLPTRRRLADVAAEEPAAPYGAIDHGGSDLLDALRLEVLPSPIADLLRRRVAGGVDDSALIDGLLRTDLTDDDEERALWSSDIAEVGRCWRIYSLQTTEQYRTLPGFLGFLTRLQRVALDEPGVRLLTVHAAKGSEFRVVSVIGFNDGAFPDRRNNGSAEELDEERRNAYVAVTRAGRVLRLSGHEVWLSDWGTRYPRAPSPFLAEMGITIEQ